MAVETLQEAAVKKKVMDELLYLYDFHIRVIDEKCEPYACGYADAIGQCILDIGKAISDDPVRDFEAYRRVWNFETVDKYKKQYRKPIIKEL